MGRRVKIVNFDVRTFRTITLGHQIIFLTECQYHEGFKVGVYDDCGINGCFNCESNLLIDTDKRKVLCGHPDIQASMH